MSSRGAYAKGIAKREEILQTALQVFARKGYDRISVREIARECGLSQAGLLHHFSTKEELFLEVLRRRDDRDGRGIPADHRHSVNHLIAAVQNNADEPGLVRLFVSMSAESTSDGSPARKFFIERYGWLRDEIAEDVRAYQATGRLAADLDPESVATLLIAVADGLQLQWLLQPDKVDMGGLLDLIWSTLGRVR